MKFTGKWMKKIVGAEIHSAASAVSLSESSRFFCNGGRMKTLRVLAVLTVLGSIAAYAGPCAPGTLQDYIDLGEGGCDLGVISFTDFFLGPVPSFAIPIDATLVQITPGGTPTRPTLMLTTNQSADAGELRDLLFHFVASGRSLAAASIALNSPTATGDAAVTGILDVCAGGLFLGMQPTDCSGTPSNAIAAATAGDAILRASTGAPLSSFFDVFTDIAIDAGPSGAASLASATVAIATVPEPSAMLLIAAGLALLGASRARRNF
jgi:hypothetical protein